MPKRTDIKKILIIGAGPIVMRVLIATDSFPPGCGGSGWSTYELASGLRSHGHSVTIVQPRPGTPPGTRIATYDDHRMAMAFALAGLRVPGVIILEPSCVSKSWPGYFDAFARL